MKKERVSDNYVVGETRKIKEKNKRIRFMGKLEAKRKICMLRVNVSIRFV
ncbi:unnamed protein product [Meloidogyne enterolobii]|uniref:Uncharacterized protein n=1 Tax=Meloidogyne enterolobii TaxID=390850 RepID=A0ACB0YLR4_MELEN